LILSLGERIFLASMTIIWMLLQPGKMLEF